jgi:F-type H+-transporting ATPase subunit b
MTAMLQDATFWAFIALVIFLALMVYLKVPGMVTAALDKRADAIRKELDDARRLREEAQALLAEYQRKGREAEAEATQIIDQAKREAEALAAEASRRLDDYVASRTKLAEQKIAQAEMQAIQEVKALSADVAIAAAENILGAKVKGPAGDSLIARSIGDVKSKLN